MLYSLHHQSSTHHVATYHAATYLLCRQVLTMPLLTAGAMLYFMPLGTGVSKRKPQSWRHTGWSTPHGDFWCCQGTGIEAFARLAEHVFMTGGCHASHVGADV